MNNIIFLMIVIAIGLFFTIFGIYAWRRKEPMWFWSGRIVRENEITDVRAFNRANGIMWLAFSAVFWLSAVLALMQNDAAGLVMLGGCLLGIPGLIFVYGKIYSKYRKR